MKPWIGRESGLVKPSHSISKFCQELAQVWILDFGLVQNLKSNILLQGGRNFGGLT